MSNLIVIGGVAAGMSAASKAKRLDKSLNVIALEKSPHVSYGACGMPYNLLRSSEPMEKLVVISADEFRRERGIDVRLRTEALELDIKRQRVKVRNAETGAEETLPYDKLVYAAGAEAIMPPFPGLQLKGVFPLRTLAHGAELKGFMARNEPRTAVIIGGGAIGLEMAHVLTELGLKVAIVEKMPSIMAGFEPQVVEPVRQALIKGGVELHEGVEVKGFEGDSGGRVRRALTDGPELKADLVLVSIGIKPATALAESAGLELGVRRAVAVDRRLRTSAENIWAAGDCAEQYHRILGKNSWIPLGTNANKQGRIAGENAAGGDVEYQGMIGSAAFRTLGADVARTGLGADQARTELGCEVNIAVIDGHDRAGSYGPQKDIRILLISRKGSGELLGAQLVGGGVAKRCDIFAAAIHAGLTVRDIQSLDLTYAPPFAPVWDPVLVAANVAERDFEPGDMACRFCDIGFPTCGE